MTDTFIDAGGRMVVQDFDLDVEHCRSKSGRPMLAVILRHRDSTVLLPMHVEELQVVIDTLQKEVTATNGLIKLHELKTKKENMN